MTADFVVRRSTIPGAGLGLFTNRSLRKDDRIMEYGGSLEKIRLRKTTHDCTGYCFEITDRIHLNGSAPSSGLARYINDARGRRNNLISALCGTRVLLYALRDIRKGDELFLDYGKTYWDPI